MTRSGIGDGRKRPTVSENSRQVSAINIVRGLITLTRSLSDSESQRPPLSLSESELVQSIPFPKVIELSQRVRSL